MNIKRKLISLGSLTGRLLYGSAGFVLVQMIKPHLTWTIAANFVANYHLIQNLPYNFSFILIGSTQNLNAALYMYDRSVQSLNKLHILLTLIWFTIFATITLFICICQTTFFHYLINDYQIKLKK